MERRTVKRAEMEAAITEAVDKERRRMEEHVRLEVLKHYSQVRYLLDQCPDIKAHIEGMRAMANAAAAR